MTEQAFVIPQKQQEASLAQPEEDEGLGDCYVQQLKTLPESLQTTGRMRFMRHKDLITALHRDLDLEVEQYASIYTNHLKEVYEMIMRDVVRSFSVSPYRNILSVYHSDTAYSLNDGSGKAYFDASYDAFEIVKKDLIAKGWNPSATEGYEPWDLLNTKQCFRQKIVLTCSLR